MYKLYALHETDLVEFKADGVILKTEDGQTFELYYRKSDKLVCLSAGRGRLSIEPLAANAIYLKNIRE